MSTAGTPVILLVEDDARIRNLLLLILDQMGSFRVETAPNGVQGLAAARALRPDLVLSDYSMPEMDGFALCREVRADPALEGCLFVIITGFHDPELKVQGLNLGVDDYLTKPVDAAELIAKVRAMMRLKALGDRLRAEKAELEALRAAQGRSFDQLLTLLLRLIEQAHPGAEQRGERLAEAALQLAARFEVPAELHRDLALAARLHELGEVVTPELRTPAGTPAGTRDWRYVLATQAMLRDVDQLGGVAEIVSAMYENWDGSGMPDRRQLGQIPLRSRFLRTLGDFFALLDAGRSTEAALGELERHAGTWYDPAVVAQWRTLLGEAPGMAAPQTRRRVPISDLASGMVLADDLVTGTGIKLLSAGTRLADATLDIIQRRHQSDPIVTGAWIEA